MAEIKIGWPKWDKLVNPSFIPTIYNTDRYLILWGGRGSSKSDAITKKLIYRCLFAKYFRYLLVRKNYNTVKNSQWQTIKDIIHDLKLERLFRFKETPLEITCINGNKFIAVGCDNVSKIKSIKDPTGAWYEEDIPDESDWTTITTSIRTQKASYLQEVFTINPEVEGAYEDNWFWKRFFQDRVETNFRGVTTIKVEGQQVDLAYTSHHSTYHDNKWIPIEFKAFLESMRLSNPYYYTIYTLGHWGNKIIGSRAYKNFDRGAHVTRVSYEPEAALHLSFDFNVRPYLTCTVWQVEGELALQVDEILGVDPNNRTRGVCELFKKKYPRHDAGLFIYGDPSGVQEDTRTEKGSDDFAIIMNELRAYHPKKRVALSAPPVVQRMGWINDILAGLSDIKLYFSDRLNYTIMDYNYGKEAADGTKFKEKTKDEDGVQFERYHHITDANDYFLCFIFRKQFSDYLRGHRQHDYMAGTPKRSVRG